MSTKNRKILIPVHSPYIIWYCYIWCDIFNYHSAACILIPGNGQTVIQAHEEFPFANMHNKFPFPYTY